MLCLPRDIGDPILNHTEQGLFLFIFCTCFLLRATKYFQQPFWKKNHISTFFCIKVKIYNNTAMQ